MTDAVEAYSFWHRALAITDGKRALTREEQQQLVVTEDPGCGFFRRRTMRAGPYAPLAIWPQGEVLVAVQDGKAVAPEDVWTYACRWPITEAAYHARVNTGRWEDEDTAVSASLEPPPPAPTLGDNFPPGEDPATEIQRKVDAASANAKDYVTIKDEVTAGKAQSVRSRLLELAGEAEKEHEVEKRPVLDAGRVIDKKWLTPAKAARAVADDLRKALSAFATAQKNAAEAAARAARVEAERQAALAASSVTGPQATLAPEPPVPAAPVPVAPTQIGGAYGRRASVRTIRVVTAIDYDKAVLALKNHPELKDLIAKLAQRAVDKGVEVEGVTYEEREDVR